MSFSELFARLKINPDEGGFGEYARLFPALSEKGKEGRAASIFLACLAHIPEFANELLSPLGRTIGRRSSVVALTEVKLPDAKGDRPDGLIAVKTGISFWTCLVEFKVGGKLETDQVERYLKLARHSDIDAVLTISNDIVSTPVVSPVNVNGRLTRSVELFHVSWMQILSHLELLIANDLIEDRDQRMIIKEFIRFLFHPSTGIKGFEQMPSEWTEILDACRDRKGLRKTGATERAVVDGWIQEERELALILSSKTGSLSQVIRSRSEKASHQAIVDVHLSRLVEKSLLSCSIAVESAAAPIDVELDLQSRTIRFSMQLRAPKDRSQAKACVTWLAKQLSDENVSGIDVEADWLGRRATSHATFGEIREDPYALVEDRGAGLPTKFRIVMRQELQRSAASRKGVISTLEKGIKDFYERVGQNVSSWVAPAPKSRKKTTAEEIVDQATVGETQSR